MGTVRDSKPLELGRKLPKQKDCGLLTRWFGAGWIDESGSDVIPAAL
jgi:hypothetical protein